MSETNDTENRGSAGGKTLSLRRNVGQGSVKQNFSHGRSKTVVVETKRKRVLTPGSAPEADAAAPAAPRPAATPPKPMEAAPKPAAPVAKPAPERDRESVVLRTLSPGEQDARVKALADARIREQERTVREAEEAHLRAEEEAAKKREADEAAKREAKETAKRQAEEEQAAAEAAVMPPPEEKKDTPVRSAPEVRKEKDKRETKPTQTPARKTQSERRRGKLTISNALDDNVRQRSLAAMRRRQERQKQKSMGGSNEPREKISREVIVPEAITIQELGNRMAERGVDIIKFLMKQGEMHQITDVIDADTAELIAEEFNHTIKRVSEADVEEGIMGDTDDDGDLVPRAAVVTVMGHVDHGKTSLLDGLRNANVVSGEAGGITQHIGAYQVAIDGGQVTFIDTPGHAAFTAMRARGAEVTDIVVLVVAADDGVMPQTIEAINHAKAAEVPMIIAVNKMDKPDADPTRVRNELLQHEVVVESLGGDTQEIEVSALKGTNLDKLLESILLQAEILELKANPKRSADGAVVEAKLDKGRGPVATVLVQRGTLRVGDIFVAGTAWGKVRALVDDQGGSVNEAGPSVPVEVLGLNSAPEAGDQFVVVDSEGRAREITGYRERKIRDLKGAPSSAMTLEDMMSKLKENELAEVPILIKADVQGSAEAIVQALQKLGTDEVAARIVHYAVGGISESDITLATASGAVVMGFNVRANSQARDLADRAGIEIRYYNVIYDLVDDVKAAMSGLLAPEQRETFLGNAEILEVFNITKVGKVAGCRVTEGSVERGAKVRLIRDSVVIHEGTLSTLKRFKDEVKDVRSGQECGMAFENYQDIRAGDVIECYRVEEIERSL